MAFLFMRKHHNISRVEVMPNKKKEVKSEQTCNGCAFFGFPVDHKKCARCEKHIVLSKFRPNEESEMLKRMESDPEFKERIKKLAKEIT